MIYTEEIEGLSTYIDGSLYLGESRDKKRGYESGCDKVEHG